MSHFTRDSYVPGPSKAEESNTDSNSQTSEEAKIQLKTALVYCEQLLLENNKIATEPSAVIEEEHMKIGEKLYSTIMETLAENIIVIEDDLILFEEADEEGLFEEVEDSVLQSDDEYHPDEKRSKIDTDDIPLDYKIKVVNLAKEHPKWSLKNLQKKGGSRLKRMVQLKIWEEQIRRGGSTKYKYTIDKWTHDRFVEARQSNQQVTTRNLQQWALAAASQFPDLEFKASEAWVKIFKRKHRIRQRKITKFVSERETATMEETHAAAEKFRLHTRALIPNYDKDFVLNTDQTGCQYQSTYNRTLAEQGSKVVLVKRKDMNKEDFGKRNKPGKRARRHFLQLSEFERGLIIGRKTASWSTRRVAGQVDRSECTVRNCWEQWTQECTQARKTGSGANGKTTRGEDRKFGWQALVDPTVTCSTIRANVGVAIFSQTISRQILHPSALSVYSL
ncbi:HTH CENPB-type domain-containing protein [Trichonephila clavipes]|uniref:HTH CENPB-type domain-containing protein n=1 Tax=Trichonephila clavipes TaxID=2585209 RepID=A0A8X6T3G9_TRICX|nr:HTH CENPB-type domain-containing protein [Trichonephila clavipes]